MHRMYPGRRKTLNATNNAQNWLSAAKYSAARYHRPCPPLGSFFRNDGLIVWLNEQIAIRFSAARPQKVLLTNGQPLQATATVNVRH